MVTRLLVLFVIRDETPANARSERNAQEVLNVAQHDRRIEQILGEHVYGYDKPGEEIPKKREPLRVDVFTCRGGRFSGVEIYLTPDEVSGGKVNEAAGTRPGFVYIRLAGVDLHLPPNVEIHPGWNIFDVQVRLRRVEPPREDGQANYFVILEASLASGPRLWRLTVDPAADRWRVLCALEGREDGAPQSRRLTCNGVSLAFTPNEFIGRQMVRPRDRNAALLAAEGLFPSLPPRRRR